jgi:hypothetical protein
MRTNTYLAIILSCESRKASIVEHRPAGSFGIAVNSDDRALRWQHIDRISRRAQGRLLATSARLARQVAQLAADNAALNRRLAIQEQRIDDAIAVTQEVLDRVGA